MEIGSSGRRRTLFPLYVDPPPSVVRASKSFFDSCNPVAEWLRENCKLTGVRKNKAKFPEVLDYYQKVQKEKRLDCNVGRNHFYGSLRLCGLETSAGNGYEVYHGIILEPPAQPEDIAGSSGGDMFLPDEDP